MSGATYVKTRNGRRDALPEQSSLRLQQGTLRKKQSSGQKEPPFPKKTRTKISPEISRRQIRIAGNVYNTMLEEPYALGRTVCDDKQDGIWAVRPVLISDAIASECKAAVLDGASVAEWTGCLFIDVQCEWRICIRRQEIR
jgi:hypothetical protein